METKRVHEVVHDLRQKPLHVRQNIALGVAGGVTLVVALGWFAANALGGTFSLAPSTFASTDQNAPNFKEAITQNSNSFSQLVGAAGAAVGATSSPTAITIVDTQVHSTLDSGQSSSDATVIHF